jgi:hypothetical protein
MTAPAKLGADLRRDGSGPAAYVPNRRPTYPTAQSGPLGRTQLRNRVRWAARMPAAGGYWSGPMTVSAARTAPPVAT